MYPGRQIPPEVVELIVNEETSIPVLKRFALVNKTWMFFARSHLFRKITIGRDRKLFPVQNLIDRHYVITQHIRQLEIWPWEYKGYANKGKSMGHSEWKEQLDLACTLQLVNTVHLQWMKDIDATNVLINTALLATSLRKFQRLTTLMLTSCTFSGLQSFENLVLGVPNLESLSLDMVSWNISDTKDDSSLDPASGSCPPHELDAQHRRRTNFFLETLHIGRYCNLKCIVRWLLTTGSTETLSTLTFDEILADQLPAAGTLLAQLGPTLEHLTLGCKFDGPGQERLQDEIGKLNLVANTSLHTLRIRILDSYADRMRWIPMLLSDLTVPFLERVTFDIWIAQRNQLQNLPWDRIQEVLEQNAQFARVQSVTFVLRAEVMVDERKLAPWGLTVTQVVAMWMARRFPRLSERDVLRVANTADS